MSRPPNYVQHAPADGFLPDSNFDPPEAQYPPLRFPSTRSVRPEGATGGVGNTVVDYPSAARDDRSKPRAAAVAPKVQMASWDVLATINCVQSSQAAAAAAEAMPETPIPVPTTRRIKSNRSQGPVLLELRRIVFNPPDSSSRLFSTVPLCQSRGNPSLGTSVSSTCLDVLLPSSSMEMTMIPPCATGLSTGAVCIHTFSPHASSSAAAAAAALPSSVASTQDAAWNTTNSTVEYYHMPRNHRPAKAVAWRPHQQQRHVAVGLTGTTTAERRRNGPGTGGAGRGASTGTTSGHGSGSGGGVGSSSAGGPAGGSSGTGSDREYCCFVWDVEHQSGAGSVASSTTTTTTRRTKTSPLYKLSHQAGVESLGWLLEDGQTLAVGGQVRGHLQLYDLRLSHPPVTVQAHNYGGVHGIVVDPHRPWQFATFSSSTTLANAAAAANSMYSKSSSHEPVKLWDARNMDTPLTEIKFSEYATAAQADVAVSAVKWSTLEPGVLTIGVGGTSGKDYSILEYDTTQSGSRPVHVNTVYPSQTVSDFCLYPFANYSGTNKNQQAVASLFSNRLVVADTDHVVTDIARQYVAPLGISRRDGRLIHGLGQTLWVGSTSSETIPTTMERWSIRRDEDISATMMRRARCGNVVKYGMDTAANIQLLLSEEATSSGVRTSKDDKRFSLRRDSLLRLWTWIQRIEALCSPENEESEDIFRWSARSVVDMGAWDLLQMDGSGETEMKTYSEQLACNVYESPDRRVTLASCGWAGKYDLASILTECELRGDFERSAALAVWHGDIGAAVDVLQRSAASIRDHLAKKDKSLLVSSSYPETLDLISLSIAGYQGRSIGGSSPQTSSIWRRTCSTLLQRPDLSGASGTPGRSAYLRCALKFLLSIGISEDHQAVLDDVSLSLCDRVAFACRFFDRAALKRFLERCISDCAESGNIEGVTITGISKQGVKILQSFVDNFGDVQTATLVASRTIFPTDWTAERRVCAEWLGSYRSLLNSWQMWQSRALFDVDRAEMLRKAKSRQVVTAPPGVASKLMGTSGGRRTGRRGRAADPDVQAAVPSQLDARCNYCNSPLGLRSQDSTPNQWLSKMNPVLSCCPQCRKPLPRCAICMLSLGTLNPFMELTRERSRGRAPQQKIADDMSTLGNLPFAEWFTWCMRCKHGGHAHHLVGWFSKHEVCPVSDCDCRCQFDGIQQLNRPALSRPPTLDSETLDNV